MRCIRRTRNGFLRVFTLSRVMLLVVFLSPVVSTLAGGGAGTKGDWVDGAGAAAAFNTPIGVAVDASGNVLVADTMNHRVRRVTPSGGMRLPIWLGSSRGRGWWVWFFCRALLQFSVVGHCFCVSCCTC